LRATHVGALDPWDHKSPLPPFLVLDSPSSHSHPMRTKLKITLPKLRNMILGKVGEGPTEHSMGPSFPHGMHTNSQLYDPTEEVGTLYIMYTTTEFCSLLG
jgi:hypothetical protein